MRWGPRTFGTLGWEIKQFWPIWILAGISWWHFIMKGGKGFVPEKTGPAHRSQI